MSLCDLPAQNGEFVHTGGVYTGGQESRGLRPSTPCQNSEVGGPVELDTYELYTRVGDKRALRELRDLRDGEQASVTVVGTFWSSAEGGGDGRGKIVAKALRVEINRDNRSE